MSARTLILLKLKVEWGRTKVIQIWLNNINSLTLLLSKLTKSVATPPPLLFATWALLYPIHSLKEAQHVTFVINGGYISDP